MIKTYNNKVKARSGSGSGSRLRFLAGSGFNEYGSETLLKRPDICFSDPEHLDSEGFSSLEFGHN